MTTSTQTLIHKDLYTSKTPALCWGNQSLTYAQLVNAASTCANELNKLTITIGDRVGIVSPNSAEYIITLLGLWLIQTIACPLNIRLPKGRIDQQLHQINAQYFIALESKALSAKHIPFSQIVKPDAFLREPYPTNSLQFRADTQATIQFTSASTKQPKAVLHTIGNHMASARGSNEYIPVVPGDQWLLSLPLYHVGGLSILFRVFLGGATVVIPDAEESLEEAIQQSSISHLSIVPTQLNRLLANTSIHARLQTMKAILVGGSSIPSSILQKALDFKWPVYTTYGLTEMASQVATARYPGPAQILNDRNVKIASDGEILVNGDTLCQGYVDGDMVDLPLNKEGWFATGDLGNIDAEHGLVVTGRKDNMFISGGENIQPEEIEHYLCQMAPVEQAIVVPTPDKEFGHRPVAFIQMDQNNTVKERELFEFLKDHLPKFKIPRQFYWWPNETSGNTMKINRKDLAQKANHQNSSLKTIT